MGNLARTAGEKGRLTRPGHPPSGWVVGEGATLAPIIENTGSIVANGTDDTKKTRRNTSQCKEAKR